MNQQEPLAVDIALVHYPVVNKSGETISSAVTNLDIHDIARAAKTYGVDNYYIVTPHTDQQRLVQEILGHWQTGYGATYNPDRKNALELVQVSETLDQVISTISCKRGKKPLLMVTSARIRENSIRYDAARKRIFAGEPVLFLFGTAHGLAGSISAMADFALPPIVGSGAYNHLSVRSAVSIILDRLLGDRENMAITESFD